MGAQRNLAAAGEHARQVLPGRADVLEVATQPTEATAVGAHVPTRSHDVIPYAEPTAPGPVFDDLAALERHLSRKSNLRQELGPYAVSREEVPAALQPELARFGDRSVCVYRVPVGDTFGLVFECASAAERANLLSLCDAGGLVATARRDWTQFEWGHLPGPLAALSWMAWVQKTVEGNLFEVVGKDNIVRREFLPASLAEAALRYPAHANWFQIPDSGGAWVCQYAQPPTSRAHVIALDGAELTCSSRDFSDYRFERAPAA